MNKSEDLKEVSIVQQLRLALKMLNGHPGIESVIDLKAARKFFNMLDTTTAAYIPDFSKVDASKIQMIKKDIEGKLEDWEKALKDLPYFNLYDDQSGNEELGLLIEGSFPLITEDDKDNYITIQLYNNNRCEFGSLFNYDGGLSPIEIKEMKKIEEDFDAFEGTWADGYIKLANHLNTLASKAKIPPLPATLVSA